MKNEKDVGAGNTRKIKQNKEFTITYCRRCVRMIGNRISGYLYSKRFSESNEKKCTVFQIVTQSLIVHKNAIKNCPSALQAFSFQSLSLYPLFSFHKGKDTSAISQPSVQHLVSVFPIFFHFHKCLITSTSAKISL